MEQSMPERFGAVVFVDIAVKPRKLQMCVFSTAAY
jgi:hypothetical protein